MTSGEILDSALGVYQTMGWTLLRVAVVPSLMSLAALIFVFYIVLPSLLTTNASGIGGELIEAGVTLVIAVCVGGPLFFLGVSYAGAAITQIVGDHIVGSVPNLGAAHRAARRNLWRVLSLSFTECVLSLLGFVVSAAMLMASAWISTRYPNSDLPTTFTVVSILALVFGFLVFPVVLSLHAIAIPACVHENISVRAAIKRGRRLLKGVPPFQPSGYDTVSSLFVLAGLLLVLVFGGISGTLSLVGVNDWIMHLGTGVPFRPVLVEATHFIAPFLAIWTIVPVWCTTTTILYFERRIRLEGYDIESLAKDIWLADRTTRFEL